MTLKEELFYYSELDIQSVRCHARATETVRLREPGDDESRSTPACTQTSWTGTGPDVLHMCSSAAPNPDPEVIGCILECVYRVAQM